MKEDSTKDHLTEESEIPYESLYSKRDRLNISHYNALRNAFSNLARIDDFDLEELGNGFFSDVFKVTHKSTGQVMVLKRNKSTNTKMNILRELQLMNKLSHPNILKLMGACVHEGQLHALTEFINGGDLDQLILKKDQYLSWNVQISIALDIALGMEYLHSFGVFHRDLSAKNCLIRVNDSTEDCKYSAIVADFGLAEKIPTSVKERNNLHIVGTPYVIAPEVLRDKPYDQTADVFSFGILLCQLIARLPCDPEELPRTDDFGLDVELYKSILYKENSNERWKHSFNCPDSFLQLAIDCCEVEPTLRPSFCQIVSKLQLLKDNVLHDRNLHMSEASYNDNSLNTCILHSGTEEIDENNFTNNTEVQLRPNRVKENRNGSRLSMSFSDVSWELINHAANMANANVLQTGSTDNEANSFTNPFTALEFLNGQLDQKLVDAPSETFLEMTLNMKKCEMFQNCNQQTNRFSVNGDDFMMSTESFHRLSPTDEFMIFKDPPNHLFHHKRAIHRAMVLSPSGGGLSAWWRAQRSSTAEEEQDTCDRHSKAEVISALSRNSRHMRRHCISMPDLKKLRSVMTSQSEVESTSDDQNDTIETSEDDAGFETVHLHQNQEMKKDLSENNFESSVRIKDEVCSSDLNHENDDQQLFSKQSWKFCICGVHIPVIDYSHQ